MTGKMKKRYKTSDNIILTFWKRSLTSANVKRAGLSSLADGVKLNTKFEMGRVPAISDRPRQPRLHAESKRVRSFSPGLSEENCIQY